jgi:hypothetical protein
MNAMSLISILAAVASAIAILAALRWYVSGKARDEKADLAKTRLASLRELRLGACEKARIERFLDEVNSGRMTFEEAQYAIGAEWIATYGPTRRPEAWRESMRGAKYSSSAQRQISGNR